eukprot:1363799-Amphidinium_carterae.1
MGGRETTQELLPKAASARCAKMATKRTVGSAKHPNTPQICSDTLKCFGKSLDDPSLVTHVPFCENSWVCHPGGVAAKHSPR